MEPVLTLDLATWAFIGGTLVPIVVGVLTKINLHPGAKAVMNIILSSVVGLIAAAQEVDGVLRKETVVATGIALLTSLAVHFGVWKPMEVTGSTGIVQRATEPFGIGPSSRGTTVRP